MLILTRRTKEQISFPELGITVQFLRIRSGQARVGVDAPADVRIIRGEIESAPATPSVSQSLTSLPRTVRHAIRNELHQISVGMHLYRELAAQGLSEEARETFSDLQEAIVRLDTNRWLNRPSNQPEQESPQQSVSDHGGADSDSRPQLSIALVEDDDNEREMLAGFLRLKGYHVDGYANGQIAVDSLRDQYKPPSVVLVDMQMPVCDGAETVRCLRNQNDYDKTTIFAVSGSSPEELGLEIGKRSGVDQWFPKPLNPGHLVSAIERSTDTMGVAS